MPDANTTNADAGDSGTQEGATSADTGDNGPDWKSEAEKWKDLARKHEERAKTNSSAAKELEQLRQQSMTDLEKAIAQAKAEGKAEGLSAGMSRIAAAEIRAAAAGRLTPAQLETLVAATNLAVFIGEDGDVDRNAVAQFVDGIAPKPDETGQDTRQGFPDLGQGARGGGQNAALNGDPLLRDIKSKLGIR